MRHASLYRYELPLAAPFPLRGHWLETRCGLIVRLSEDQDQDQDQQQHQEARQGWGEIAPLPYFSQESLTQAQHDAVHWLQAWSAGGEPELSALPAVAFGIDCALAELDGRLPLQASYQTVPLWTTDMPAQLDRLTPQLAKLKVGIASVERDSAAVRQLLETLPNLSLRLDANQRWTLEQARAFAHSMGPTLLRRIVFIEEPCVDPAHSLQLAAETGLSIAWDESARVPGFTLQRLPGVAALIVKPTLTGSLRRCQAWIEQAHRAKMQAIVSSSIESSLGLTQLGRLAAWLTPHSPPGLDTLQMTSTQIVRRWPGSSLPLLTARALQTIWKH